MILFYTNKINSNEDSINALNTDLQKISNKLTENFNYLKEIYNLRVEIEMLKKKGKRAEIDFIDITKIILAIIFIYVIAEIIRSAL